MTTTPDWVHHAVFYQIFPDRFSKGKGVAHSHLTFQPWSSKPTQQGYQGGNLQGIVDQLENLIDLGVTALYPTPIFQSASNHRYHTDDYYTIDPLLGGHPAFKTLLAALKATNVKLVLDGVFNHTGRGFFPFHDLVENGPDSPWVDWYRIEAWPISPYHPRKKPNYPCWFNHRALPKLNHDHPDVREFIMQVGEYWVEQGIDGWRLDVPHEIHAEGFWQTFRHRIKTKNPEAYLVGEILGDAAHWLDGHQFDGVMNYLFRIFTLRFASGGHVDPAYRHSICGHKITNLSAKGYGEKIQSLLQRYPWEHQLAQLNLLSSHDTPRVATLLQQDEARIRIAVFLLLTFPGAPCIYYGDEVGLLGGHDPDCRRTYPPRSEWDNHLRQYYQALISCRRAQAALRTGRYQVCYTDQQTYVFARHLNQETVLGIVHRSTQPRTLRLDRSWFTCNHEHADVHLLFGEAKMASTSVNSVIHLPAMACLLLKITHNGAKPSVGGANPL